MRLQFLNGELSGGFRQLAPPGISLGRETDNDVQMLIGGVSRYHAKIEFSNGAWLLRDLGSTNGTKINGEKLSSPKPIKIGDIIIMGDQTMRIVSDGEKPSEEIRLPSSSETVQPAPLGHSEPTMKEIALPKIPQGPSIIFQPAPQPEPSQPAAPAANAQPSSAHAPAIEQSHESFKQHAKSIFDTIKAAVPTKLEGDIFSKSKQQSQQSGQQQGGGAASSGKGRFSNFLFYVALVSLAVICLSVFVMMQQESARAAANAANASKEDKQPPFMLVYDKQRVTKDNIFRFALTVENGSAVFTLDDLRNNRHFMKSFGKANPVFLKNLEEAVRKSDFMKLQQEPPGVSEDGSDELRNLVILQGNNFNKISVRNTYAKSSFEDIEMAIDQFAEDFSLRTVSLSVDEMKEEAEKAFLKAESLFDNYQARPENLRNAITRYQLTLDYLDQLEPKPKEWDIARKRQQEAQAILDTQLKEVTFSFNRNLNVKDIRAAVDDCQKIMDLCDPQDIRYQKAHNYKVKLESMLRQQRSK